jgi:hypothetical protein
VNPVPDPLLIRKYNSAGNRTRTSGSLAKYSDCKTREAVSIASCILNIKSPRITECLKISFISYRDSEIIIHMVDRHCGVVVLVPGYRSRG